MTTSTNVPLLRRTDAIARHATSWLEQKFAEDFARHMGVGLNGSCARGDVTPVSDIDYCVVFDEFDGAREVDWPKLIDELKAALVARFPDEPFASRFSVFWAPIPHLVAGRHEVGRFPAYDRGLFREIGVQLAGKPFDRQSIQPVGADEVRHESMHFLIEEIFPKLEALQFFSSLETLTPARVGQLGGVLVTKIVLMPMRVLHVLFASEGELFVDVRRAVEECASKFSTSKWWPLVPAALNWREDFPTSDAGLAAARDLLRACCRDLYGACLHEYHRFALATGESSMAAQVADALRVSNAR